VVVVVPQLGIVGRVGRVVVEATQMDFPTPEVVEVVEPAEKPVLPVLEAAEVEVVLGCMDRGLVEPGDQTMAVAEPGGPEEAVVSR
jgi:hypothetical protein